MTMQHDDNDDRDSIDWEDAFQNSAYIQDAEIYPTKWATRAAVFRQKYAAYSQLDIAYGKLPEEKLDLFWPSSSFSSSPKGVAIFVHGGYWLKFDKSYWSHFAKGALKQNVAVAMPSYPLAPHASHKDMSKAIANAIIKASEHVQGDIFLAGHSAGGQLVTSMICQNSPLPPSILKKVKSTLSISGLHDLQPLRQNSMNAQFKLTHSTAYEASPAMHGLSPHLPDDFSATAWVGAKERPEFLRQSALLVEKWSCLGGNITLVIEAEKHHFNILENLCNPNSKLVKAWVV